MRVLLGMLLVVTLLSGCSEKPLEVEDVFGIPLGAPVSAVENIDSYKTILDSEIEGIATSNLTYVDEGKNTVTEIKTLNDIVHSVVIYQNVTRPMLDELIIDMKNNFGEPERDTRNNPDFHSKRSFFLVFPPKDGTLYQAEFGVEYLGEEDGNEYFKTSRQGKTKKLYDIQVKIFKEAIEGLNRQKNG